MTRLRIAILLSVLGASTAMAQRASHYELGSAADPVSAADSGLKASVAIDIIRHGGGIWLSTGKGLQVTYDNGLTWLNHTTATGIVSDNVSGIFSLGSRL